MARSWNSATSPSSSQSHSGEEREETEYLHDDSPIQEEDVRAEIPEDEMVDECLERYQDIYEDTFDELRLPIDVVEEVRQAFSSFIQLQSSKDAAGEAIYAAVFDAAPSLQNLFKTPRSVMSLRFMNGIISILNLADDPAALKAEVQSVGFRHLDREVTPPRAAVFRDAIADLLDLELPNGLSSKARLGLQAILNYAAGSFIYIRKNYSTRVRVIQRSWRIVNNKAEEGEDGPQDGEQATKTVDDFTDDKKSKSFDNSNGSSREEVGRKDSKKPTDLKVPKTFNEMFLFNAAVMGFASSAWMQMVLDQFDDIVCNVANSYRLQEECDVLTLVLAKHRGPIKLPEFKAVMLASLRSLLPKDWDSTHEVAWNWLWENVERILRTQINPKAYEEALARFMQSMDESDLMSLRQGIYKEFFAVAPAGQDYFKQSTTRLYFISDKVMETTCLLYRDPRNMVEEISGLGLRHVAYEIPTELFSPFVSSAVKVLGDMTTDETATAAFRWSMNLVSKILVRTLIEGSTIVMKAINTNEQKVLQRAIAVAPRGKRAMELLEIRVGTQTISPFYWALESGSFHSAKAMIIDLLSIRADRDNYYYGCDDLFRRHPEVVHKLCVEAPTLLPTLLDGLVWRARKTIQGTRRVNYFVKHLLQDDDGKFNKALEWLVDFNCPKIISHSVVEIFTDMLWSRVARYYFLIGRLYFFSTLCVFAVSQAILPSYTEGALSAEENLTVFICRCYIYVGCMCHLLVRSIRLCCKDFRSRNFNRPCCIPVPEHLCSMSEFGNMCLFWTLFMMCIQEPILWCLGDPSGDGLLFTSNCDGGRKHADAYAALSCVAMLLYCALVVNLSILSMRISSFVMVCGAVLSEVGLFLMAASFLIVSFALGICSLAHQSSGFQGLGNAAYSLFAIMLGLFPSGELDAMQEHVGIIITVSIFVIFIAIFLLNLLVAQLNQAYQIIFPDMQGYARLTRAGVIVSGVEHASRLRWQRFLSSLQLDQRLEFEEGDVGLAGGIQVTEPSWAHPTTVDSIRRFGGSTSADMPWPEDEKLMTDDDRFERLEKLILRCTKGKKKKGGTGDTSGQGTESERGSYKSDSSNMS